MRRLRFRMRRLRFLLVPSVLSTSRIVEIAPDASFPPLEIAGILDDKSVLRRETESASIAGPSPYAGGGHHVGGHSGGAESSAPAGVPPTLPPGRRLQRTATAGVSSSLRPEVDQSLLEVEQPNFDFAKMAERAATSESERAISSTAEDQWLRDNVRFEGYVGNAAAALGEEAGGYEGARELSASSSVGAVESGGAGEPGQWAGGSSSGVVGGDSSSGVAFVASASEGYGASAGAFSPPPVGEGGAGDDSSSYAGDGALASSPPSTGEMLSAATGATAAGTNNPSEVDGDGSTAGGSFGEVKSAAPDGSSAPSPSPMGTGGPDSAEDEDAGGSDETAPDDDEPAAADSSQSGAGGSSSSGASAAEADSSAGHQKSKEKLHQPSIAGAAPSPPPAATPPPTPVPGAKPAPTPKPAATPAPASQLTPAQAAVAKGVSKPAGSPSQGNALKSNEEDPDQRTTFKSFVAEVGNAVPSRLVSSFGGNYK